MHLVAAVAHWLWCPAVAVGLALLGPLLRHRHRRRLAAEASALRWRELAPAVDSHWVRRLPSDQGGRSGVDFAVSGVVGDLPVIVAVYQWEERPGTSDSFTNRRVAVVVGLGQLWPHVKVVRALRGWPRRWARTPDELVGGIGRRRFDRHFVVRTADRDAALRLLDDALVEEHERLPRGVREWSVEGRELIALTKYRTITRRRLLEDIEPVLRIARHLQRKPRPAEV
jgi:hypothetical protein